MADLVWQFRVILASVLIIMIRIDTILNIMISYWSIKTGAEYANQRFSEPT